MILVVFGGAGLIMIAGSIALFTDEDVPAGIGMLIPGLLFCAAGYFGSRAFAPPKGARAVPIRSGSSDIRGVLGQAGRLEETAYVYVDGNTPEDEIRKMQDDRERRPWTRRSDWAKGTVIQEGVSDIRLLVVFTVIWNIIGWGIAVYGIRVEWNSPAVPWFLVVFPAFGMALMYRCIRTSIRNRKFGLSIMHSSTMSFHPGGRMQGTIQTGVPVKTRAWRSFLSGPCVLRKPRSLTPKEKTASSMKFSGAGMKRFPGLFRIRALLFRSRLILLSPVTCPLPGPCGSCT